MAQLIYKPMQNHQKWRTIQAGSLLQLVYKLRCLYKVGVRRERYVVNPDSECHLPPIIQGMSRWRSVQ